MVGIFQMWQLVILLTRHLRVSEICRSVKESTNKAANYKGVDQTALICIFVVHIWHKRVLSRLAQKMQ